MAPDPICGPRDMGLVIYTALSQAESDVPSRYSDFATSKGIPLQELSAEVIAVRWIAADYGVTQECGESPRRNAVLDALLDCLEQGLEPDLLQFLTNRICQYAVVLNQDVLPPEQAAGAAFARLLFQRRQASKADLGEAAMIGCGEFWTMNEAVKQSLHLVQF